MTFADDLIYDESRRHLFQPGLPNFTTYRGCSTLAGRNIDLYSLGSSRVTVRAEHTLAEKIARRAACRAARLASAPQPAPRVSTPRLPRPRYPSQLTYAARRQAAHDAAWAASAPHFCECGCRTDMRAGHFSRPPKCFEQGHNAVKQGWKQWQKGRRAGRERAAAVECTVAAA